MKAALLLTGALGMVAFAAPSKDVTYYKDVLPVLQNRCQECHRPGEAGPMQFTDYKSTRPWAKAIKNVVATKKMPPWFADPKHGKFINDRSLSEAELNTLIAWADTGAKEGNPKDAPAPKKFVEGWNIGKPDAVIEMPQAFDVPASGTIEYQYVVLPTNFTEDKWVSMAEVRPGDRGVVHHVIAFIRPKGMPWMADAKPGVPFVPTRTARQARTAAANAARDPQRGVSEAGMAGTELLVGYAPGMEAQICPPGTAKLLPAGADIVFQMHYTANGKPGSDKTKIGLVFAKEPPTKRILTMNATNASFVIPAGAPAHEVTSSITLRDDSQLVSLMPHMHLRGKDFKYTLTYPTGESEVVLNVPRYDFNWQLFYYLSEAKTLPKGTRIDCVAHFDNSPNNPANPNPKEEVRWGDQSWEEMMIGWFDLAIDVKANPLDLYRGKKAPVTGE